MIRRRLSVYTMMMVAGISAGYYFFDKLRLLSGIAFLCGVGIMSAFFFPKEERIKCGLSLLIGFIIFAAAYANFESADISDEVLLGRVLNAADKGEYYRLTIREESSRRKISLDSAYNPEMQDSIADLIGADIEAHGKPKELYRADNPGCFDYLIYMRSLGISGAFKADSIRITKNNQSLITRFRKALFEAKERFLGYFSEDSRAFLKGIVFGDKSEIEEDVLKEFNLNSSGHILAVSGLHIGFLYALLRLLSGSKTTWPISVAIISVLLIYAEMTMWSASVVRAIIVMSINLLSFNLNRRFDLLSSLASAAIIILICRPYMLFNAGFQLSFAAMLAIAFLGKRLSALFGNLLGVTFAVQVGTIPLIAMSYHRVNLLAFAINVPIIMLSSLLVPLCILALMTDIAIAYLPGFVIKFIDFCCESLVMINHILSFDYSFSNLVAGISPILTILFYLIIGAATCEWTRINLIRKDYKEIKKLISLMAIPLIMICSSLFNSFRDDEIVFLSVGQGDSVHIRSGDKDMLIDGGGSDFINTGERILMPYLLSSGAPDVDMAFITHLHKDHFLGIKELSMEYPVRAIGVPSIYAYSKGGSDIAADEIIYIKGESEISIGEDVSVRTLWPLASETKRIDIDDPNEHNMVYMIDYRGLKIMVTGDLLEEDELKMCNHYKGTNALKCDILKIAHHGSKSSSSEEFLDAAKPEIAVIQVGRNNIYGHPHAQTLDRLKARGIEVYRTDINGAVGIDIKRNGNIRVDTMRGTVLELSGTSKETEAD